MRKILCDMCSRDITRERVYTLAIVYKKHECGKLVYAPDIKNKELCPFCKEALLKWLNEYETSKEV